MFCKECGHRFIADLEEMICPICNVMKGKGHKFCPFCGEPVEEGQVICGDCGLNIDGEISQMGDGMIDTGFNFYQIKSRNLWVCAMLMLVSCGAYWFYWMICLSEEYAEIAGTKNDRILYDLILTSITFGLYGVYWAYKQAKTYEEALRKNGREKKEVRLLFCAASLIGTPALGCFVMQHYMNRF